MTKTNTKNSLFAIFVMTSILLLSPSMASNAFATTHLIYADELVSATINHSNTNRDDPNQALGPEDHTSGNSGKFVALGFHGSITLGYDQPVGGILTVFETTNGSWPLEEVNVEVSSDGTSWNSVGIATNQNPSSGNSNIRVSTFDLEEEGIVGCISFVRLTDETVTFSNTKPGPDYFDVDAVGLTGDVACLPPLEICEPDTMDLIAGQHIDSGDVTLINDGTTLLVTIQTQDGWQLSESHLQIGETLDDFPLTKKGNPKVGNFDYQREYNPLVTEDTYEFLLADLGLSPGDTITFAVHTVVVQTDSDGEIIAEETAWKQGERFVEKGNWAMYNTYDIQECDVIE